MFQTPKEIKLQSCAKSQIAGNSFALLNLMWFFKIGLELSELLPPEVDTVFFQWLNFSFSPEMKNGGCNFKRLSRLNK